jgi:hypothetical protein
VSAKAMSAERLVGASQPLCRVERAFRCLQSNDLKIRPIDHSLDGRIVARGSLQSL